MVLEYAENGNLYQYMKKNCRYGFEPHTAKRLFEQVCSAVRFMHGTDIVHRDIKPENILLDGELNAKICDFGWSVEISRDEQRQTFCGTYEYMAPEIFENEEYTSSVDIWSLGVLLYELTHGRSPFVEKSVFKIYKNILTQEIMFKNGVGEDVKELITAILKTDPRERMEIEEICEHAFFEENDLDYEPLTIIRREILPSGKSRAFVNAVIFKS